MYFSIDIGLTLSSAFQIFEWILYKSSYKPDVICYNLLIEAYGQKSLYKEAESTYLELLDARCIPTEDTYALLIKAYCKSGSLGKAEAIVSEMRKNGVSPSMISFSFLSNFYLHILREMFYLILLHQNK